MCSIACLQEVVAKRLERLKFSKLPFQSDAPRDFHNQVHEDKRDDKVAFRAKKWNEIID